MTDPLVTIKQLNLSYRSLLRKHRPALIDVNLTIGRGEVWGLVGRNGAGKSTLLRCIVGLLQPDSGHLSICGEKALSPEGHSQLGYLPDGFTGYSELSVQECLETYGAMSLLAPAALRSRIEWVLGRFELIAVRHKRVATLSKGTVQSLGLAQSLLHDPEVIVWDEPTNGLDPIGRASLKNIIHELKGANKTVLIATHGLADADAVCDRLAFIKQGRVHKVVSVEQLRAAHPTATLEDIFVAIEH